MLLGDLVVWYYERFAGIKSDPSKPAYKHIIMKPVSVGDLSFIKASYQSMYGLVKSEWHYKNDKFNWDINIPVNTTATVYIPAEKEGDVTEGGKEITMAAGIKFVKSEDGRAVF